MGFHREWFYACIRPVFVFSDDYFFISRFPVVLGLDSQPAHSFVLV